MKRLSKRILGGICVLPFAVTVFAAPGDIHEVSGAMVNLRSGPSDATNVLTTVERGDELLELRREGSWLGVRVMATGDEGWIYGELVRQVARSRLEQHETSLSLGDLSIDFDRLMGQISEHLGYIPVARIERMENATLRVTAAPEWQLRAGLDAHLMAASALYQMWKENQGGGPVRLVLADARSETYITIEDGDVGPRIIVRDPPE